VLYVVRRWDEQGSTEEERREYISLNWLQPVLACQSKSNVEEYIHRERYLKA
jgi:hypothetical protein